MDSIVRNTNQCGRQCDNFNHFQNKRWGQNDIRRANFEELSSDTIEFECDDMLESTGPVDIKESKIYDAVHPIYKNVMSKLPSHPHLHQSMIEFLTCLDNEMNATNSSNQKRNSDDVVTMTTCNHNNSKGTKRTKHWAL